MISIKVRVRSLIIDYLLVVVLLQLYSVMDALLQLFQPPHPNITIKVRYVLLDISLQSSQAIKSLKLQLFRYIIFPVVVPEIEIGEVKSLGWCDGHADLISEEGIVDEIGWVAVAHDHYDASDDLSDLMVDEALPDDVETEVIFVHYSDCELYDVSLCLCILCLQVFRVVVEVVGSNVQIAAFIELLHDFLLFLNRPSCLQHICLLFCLFFGLLLRANEHDLGANVRIMPRSDHVSYLKPVGDSLEAVIHNLTSLKKLLQLCMKSLLIQRLVLQQIVVGQAEKTGYSVDYCVYALISPCCSRPSLVLLKLAEIIGGQQFSRMQFLNKKALDSVNMALYLKLHAVEGRSIIPKKYGEPQFRHDYNKQMIQSLNIFLSLSTQPNHCMSP